MYLSRGWEKFYRAYDLRLGYFLLFRYDDDATMLTVGDITTGREPAYLGRVSFISSLKVIKQMKAQGL